MNSEEELEAIKALLAEYGHEFDGSEDWSQSDTLGKVHWLIRMFRSKKKELDAVWEMLASASPDSKGRG